MARISLLDGVHRERADGIYAKLIGHATSRPFLTWLCDASNRRRLCWHEWLLVIWQMDMLSSGYAIHWRKEKRPHTQPSDEVTVPRRFNDSSMILRFFGRQIPRITAYWRISRTAFGDKVATAR